MKQLRRLTIVVVVQLAMLGSLLVPSSASALAPSDVLVNELVASNTTSLTDEDGDAPDWIELFNPGGSTIDLGGAYLTDTAAVPTMWQFPAGTTLAAGGHLVIFASDKNRAVAGQPLHTNFKLSSAGEQVFVIDADGITVIDSVTFPALATDVAYGRASNGGLGVLAAPTPGAANSASGASSVTMTPSTTFQGSLAVSLAQAGDGVLGTIRYTTDRSEPTSSSPIYGGPIVVSSTTVVRAKVFAAASTGVEAHGVYTAVAAGLPTSDLPVVVVDSFATPLDREVPRTTTITVLDTVGGVASPLGTVDFAGLSEMEIRGSSSAGFPKKQYKIELKDAAANDVDADLLGLGSEEDWILYAPGRFDRNMISNALMQSLAGDLGLTEMNYQFVELYLSDNGGVVDAGDYDGLYLLMETIKIDSERIDVAKLGPSDNAAPEVTGGYILSIDRVDDGEYWFPTQQTPAKAFQLNKGINVVRPKAADLTTAQQSYIQGYIEDFEAALFGPNFANPSIGYRAYVDVPSFIDTHILRYLSKDPDTARLSTYFSKDRGGLLRADPVWDQDRSFESDDVRDDEPREPYYGDSGVDPFNDGWWGRMFEDPAFRAAYVSRWNQLRTGVLSDAALQSTIRELSGVISSAYGREDARWGAVNGYGSRFGGLAGETAHLEDWLETRAAFIDETVNELTATNLAEGKFATQSSTGFGGDASRAVDGDVNGRYDGNTWIGSPGSVTHTGVNAEAWWQVDLGSVQPIDRIRVWNRSDCCTDRLSNFHVLVSDVPFTSTSLAATQAQAGVSDLAFSGSARRTESFETNRTGRYVRVQLEGTQYLSLAEVEVFQGVATPVVVDLSQTAYDYDFGTPSSPVGVPGANWQGITPLTSGDISWSGPVNAVDRGAGVGANDINRDLVYSNGERTLSHRIANGYWDVTLNMGDANFSHDNMAVTSEGVQLAADVDAPSGSFASVTGTVFVNDGTLDVTFDDLGGADPNWVATRLSLRRSEAPASGLILNEWNAVSSDKLIDGGDSYFGSVLGNGGDWFELVVVEDGLDVRGWQLELSDSDAGAPEVTDTLVFGADPLLANLRAGTIITVSEDLADDTSFDPATGDWWINLQAESGDSGAYFTADSQSNFNTDNDDWQIRILDSAGLTRFGPAGEGVAGVAGVGSTEVGELEEDPSAAITAESLYDDGNASTFGAPNAFGATVQDFGALRSWWVPPVDSTPPVSTVVSPGPDEVVANASIVVSGSSSDENAVARVRVAIVDRATGDFLQRNGTFASTRVFDDALLASPGAPLTTWTFAATLPDGDYRAIVKADDAVGNVEASIRQSFTISTAVADVEPPVTAITDPSEDDIVVGPDVTLRGSTVDGVDVARVRVALFNRDTGLFLQPDGSFGAPRAFIEAGLASPDAPSTEWAYPMSLVDGRYRAIVKANDASGNVEAPVRREFVVSSAVADTVAPTSSLSLAKDQPVGALTIAGDSADNVGVSDVRVSVRSRDSLLWLQPDGSLAANFHAFEATLANPNTPASPWQVDVNLPAAGRYRVIVKAVDTSNNLQDPGTATNIVAA